MPGGAAPGTATDLGDVSPALSVMAPLTTGTYTLTEYDRAAGVVKAHVETTAQAQVTIDLDITW